MIEMSNFASLILYLAVYILSASLMSKSKILETKKCDMSFVVAVLLPVLLAANRYYVGTDFENYFLMYRKMSRYSLGSWITSEMSLDGIPFGIWLISRIAFQFRSHQVFYGLLAAVIYVPAVIGIKRLFPKESCFLAIFIFLTTTFSSGLNISKQAAAVSILIFSLYYIQERKFWKFLLAYFAAFCFHPTALIFIIAYFWWKPKDVHFSFKKVALLVCCAVLLLFIPQILSLFGGRFESYTEYEGEISNRTFYLSLFWLVVFYTMRHRYKNLSHVNELLITMATFSQILNLSGFVSPYVNRIAMYFGVSTSLLRAQFPLLFSEFDKKYIKVIVFVYVVAMFIAGFYVLGGAEIFPYKFYGGAW